MDLDPCASEAKSQLPRQMVVNGSDLNCGLHLRYGLTDAQNQSVLKMRGRVDEQRLAQAVRLSTIAEPILGCRFVKDPSLLYWQRRVDLDAIEWCSVLETENEEEAIDRWLSSPLDLDFDPLVKVCIIRSPTNDTLCVKLHHAGSDGSVTVQYNLLLASLYTQLASDPAYRPQPNLANREQSEMFEALGIINASLQVPPPDALAVYLRPLEPCAPAIPFSPAEPKKRRQVMRRIARWRDWFQAYKHTGATVNDVMLAAYWRTLHHYVDSTAPEPLQIAVAIDLRRYLPAGTINSFCNFYGAFPFQLNHKLEGTLSDTVAEVSAVMQHFKHNQMVLHQMVQFFEFLRRIPPEELERISYERKHKVIESKKGFIHFSNMGLISKNKIYFADTEVYDAYLVGPALCAPDFLPIVSTYQDWMTVSIAFQEPTIEAQWVEEFLDRLMKEINC